MLGFIIYTKHNPYIEYNTDLHCDKANSLLVPVPVPALVLVLVPWEICIIEKIGELYIE